GAADGAVTAACLGAALALTAPLVYAACRGGLDRGRHGGLGAVAAVLGGGGSLCCAPAAAPGPAEGPGAAGRRAGGAGAPGGLAGDAGARWALAQVLVLAGAAGCGLTGAAKVFRLDDAAFRD